VIVNVHHVSQVASIVLGKIQINACLVQTLISYMLQSVYRIALQELSKTLVILHVKIVQIVVLFVMRNLIILVKLANQNITSINNGNCFYSVKIMDHTTTRAPMTSAKGSIDSSVPKNKSVLLLPRRS